MGTMGSQILVGKYEPDMPKLWVQNPLSNWSGRVGGWDFVDTKFKSGGGPSTKS